MASAIDETKPARGEAETLNVRNNFAAAKSEIEALQDALSPVYVLDTEYIALEQHGGLYGTIYIMHFGASLPAYLTAGNNIASIHDHSLNVVDSVATSRLNLMGYTYATASKFGTLWLTGTSGSANLTTSFGADWTLTSGWVEYTK